jgi:hypothetical protein
MPDPDSPEGKPTKWIGSSRVPDSDNERERRRRFADETLDLPIAEQPEPEVRYVPVPVHYPPPPGYPYQPRPPKRRKWPWVLLIMTILCVGCCGGCAAWVQPYFQQYPASATPTATVTGLTVVSDQTLTAEGNRLRGESVESEQFGEGRFTVVYADAGDRQRRVLLFGATRFIQNSGKDLDAALDRLGASVALANRREVDPGALRGEQRCGTGRFRNAPVAVCAWADHGSIGIALFTGRDVDASGLLLHQIRSAVISRH